MKILFVNYEYPPLGGGGGVMNAQLAQEMAKHHEVTVLTSQGRNLPRDRVEEGVRVLRVPVFFRTQEAAANFSSMLAFIPMAIQFGKQLLMKERFDIINTHFVLPTGPVGNALARFADIPNVLTVHGGDLYDPSKKSSPHRHALLRAWIRQLLRKADVVVGQSKNTLENVQKFYTPEIEGALIPLGIHRPQVGQALREEYGYEQGDILLVTVGRLIRRKAVEQLIETVAALNNPQVRLLIMGTGPDEPFLREQAQRLQVAGQVHFLGFIEEVEKYRILEMCDLYVSTSQHEGFCLSFLEGMSAGLPIICYNFGGHMDYLEDGVTGYTVPLNNRGLFLKRCAELSIDPSLRQKMGEENRRRVEQFYVDTCAAHYEGLFNQAVARKQGIVPVQLRQSFTAKDGHSPTDLVSLDRQTPLGRE